MQNVSRFPVNAYRWLKSPQGIGSSIYAFLYAATFLTTCTQSPESACWLGVMPAITAGWQWGLRAGFVVGGIMLPVNAILLLLTGQPGHEIVLMMPASMAHAIAPLTGAICGRLQDLSQQLHTERDERRRLAVELQLTRRSLDQTVQLLNDQATATHHTLQAKQKAELDSQEKQRELNRIQVRLTKTSLTDIATELPNRRAAFDRLQREWSAAHAKNRPLSCLLIRFDDLLRLRAEYSLPTTDQIIRETLDVLHDAIRIADDDLFCLGGDEFLVICPNTDLTAAEQCAERLRGLVQVNTILIDDVTYHPTISIGIASNVSEPRSSQELLQSAQQALYAAERAGGNRVCEVARPTDRPAPELARAIRV